MYNGNVSSDKWMARSLLIVLNRNPSAKILVIVGSLHTLKKLEWEDQVKTKHLSIREYITQERPSKRMWSVGQMIDGNPNECDFTRKFSTLPGAVALDLGDRYRGWQMGLTVSIGHGAIVHGKHIGNRAVIGMGAAISIWSEIGEWAIVAEGTVVKLKQIISSKNSIIYAFKMIDISVS